MSLVCIREVSVTNPEKWVPSLGFSGLRNNSEDDLKFNVTQKWHESETVILDA